MHNATLAKIEEASNAGYNKAILPILWIGFIMLVGNICSWLCYVIRRRYHSCCIDGRQVGKDISCETETVGTSNPSLKNFKTIPFIKMKTQVIRFLVKAQMVFPKKIPGS